MVFVRLCSQRERERGKQGPSTEQGFQASGSRLCVFCWAVPVVRAAGSGIQQTQVKSTRCLPDPLLSIPASEMLCGDK